MALQDYYNTNDDAASALYLQYWEGQTFPAGADYDATSIKVKIYRVGSPGNITCDIYATSAGKPVDSAIGSGILNCNGITTDSGGEMVEFTLDSPTSLTASNLYAIVLHGGSGAPNRVSWRQDNGNGYGSGTRLYSSSSGAGWTVDSTRDHLFEVYGDIGTINEGIKTVTVGGGC